MRRIKVFICALSLFWTSVWSQEDSGLCDTLPVTTADSAQTKEVRGGIRDSIIQYARLHIGKPYRSGGKGPKSFDCSGFTQFVYKKFGYTLGASSAAQYKETERISTDEIKPGDLLFFKGRNASEKRVGHVALAYEIDKEEKSVTIIHAAFNGGVRFDQYPNSQYYKKRYVGAGRVVAELEPARERVEECNTEKDEITEKRMEDDSTRTEGEGKTIIRYTVKRGDNLYQLSKRHKTSVEKIKKDNHLKGNHLKIGEILIIEKGED